MDDFEEISNKINNGIPLSEEEQQSFDRLRVVKQKFLEALESKGLLPLLPIKERIALLFQRVGEAAPSLIESYKTGTADFKFEVNPALIESHKKGLAALNTKIDWDGFEKTVIRFQELYEKKKRLWEKDRNYYKNKGFDRDFEEVLDDLAKLFPELKRMRLGEVLGMPDDDFRRLFDDWFVAYEAKRNKLLEEARVRRIEQATPAPTSTEPKKHAKTIRKEQNYVNYTNRYIELRKSVNPRYNRERAINKVLKEAVISEKTLKRAFDANEEMLKKFGHEKKIFKVRSLITWS